MIERVGGNKVVRCKICKDVISWDLDINIIHGYTCTRCIDKDFGKYRVMDVCRDELISAGYKPDILSDELMSGLAIALKDEFMVSGTYWNVVDKYLGNRGNYRKKG